MTKDEKEKVKTEIEIIKKVLDDKVRGHNRDLTSNEILQLSQKLDDLILEYIKLINK